MTNTARNTNTESVRNTSSPRSVAGVFRGGPLHWVGDGFRVNTLFPSSAVPPERVSPFVLLDYHTPYEYEALPEGKRGVGWHPHRGFETVTFAWQGSVAHRDTAGNQGVIGPGDLQWMSAAGGLLHEEYHEEEFARRGGVFHMAQLWVNLPKKDKMNPPRYQGIKNSQVPVIRLPNDTGRVRVVAGNYETENGPARTFSPITVLDIELEAGADFEVQLPSSYNALVLVAGGTIEATGQQAGDGQYVLYENDGENLRFRAIEKAHLLLLSGEPLNEPVVAYGPFVMNSFEEIREAAKDFDAGKFGRIPRD